MYNASLIIKLKGVQIVHAAYRNIFIDKLELLDHTEMKTVIGIIQCLKYIQ